MISKHGIVCILLAAFVCCAVVEGQANDRIISPALGFQPAHTYAVSDIESIDKATGALSLHIPLAQLPEGPAGFTAGLTLVYNNKFWEVEQIEGVYALSASIPGAWRLTICAEPRRV
jgi:hypothetical protein